MKRVGITVRKATTHDARDIVQLQGNWARENITHGYRPASLTAIRKSVGRWCYLAETGNEVVGFITGAATRSPGLAVVPKGHRYAEVGDLYVMRRWRSRGVGRRLLNALLAEAKRRRIRYVTLYSSTKDASRVMRFYEQAGFQSWYVQMYRRLP